MSKVRFDGEEGSIELERITAKKNWMSPEQCNKMGSTYMFDALHRYMGQEMYPDLPNEVNGNVAVKQLSVYAFLKTKIEGTDQYNRKYIGNFTVGADKGDKGYFGMNNELCKDTAIRLEGTDHIKGVGFNYPWEVNGVKNIRYSADKEALCIVTGADKTAWSAILEQSYCGNKKSEVDIEAYLEQEFKPAFDCAYRANPLLVGVTMTLDEINADIDGFKALRRSSDDRQYSYCEFWIDGEYDLYYLNLERNRYEKNGVNLYDELSDEEKALVDATETLEEKNQVFINFRINRFKEEAPNYWHINDGLYQLSFLYTIAAKDNGEKNMYPYKLIPLSEGGRWRFFQDDLDSIKAKDNQGLDTAPYSVELHDFTDDKKNAYVFKGEDNAYFQALEMAYPERFQKMGKDMLQAMYDLSPKGTKTLDKLMGFFDEFFFSRAQDYFTKSAYNNDAEFYEEAWNDKEYVASVDIHPLAQSTGDHYTADRAWFEKRMLYLMAKYGFGSYSNYEDSSLGIISVRTQVAQGFTLTPAIDSFPTILGGQAQISKADHRIKAGESIKLAAVGGGNTNTYIVGADWLSDIGDLKDLSIDPSSVVVLSVASKRLRRLKVGDENPEEVTSYLATLSVQQCDSMETVDARNLKTLVGTVDLSKCPRLLEALFGGTNTTGVVIAAGSKIEHLQLPDSVTAIDLRNTKFLENFEYGTLANLGFLRLENVPTLNAFAMLKEAYNSDGSQLKDIRLVGWTYDGDATDVDMLANLANDKDKDGNHHPYNGIDAEGTPTTGNPVLEGKLNIDGYVYEETANIVKQNFPTIEFTPKGYYLRFQDPEVLRVLLANGVGDGVGITKEQAETITTIGAWFNGNTTIENFDEFDKFTGVTFLGDSTTSAAPGGFRGCAKLKTLSLPSSCKSLRVEALANCTSLANIIGLENIETIVNRAAHDTLLSQELNLSSVKGEIGYKAFAYTGITAIISLGSCTKLGDTSSSGSGVFDKCYSLKKVVIPSTMISIGGCAFMDDTALEIVEGDLTNVKNIGSRAFYNCTSLSFDELNLPSLETLSQDAFFGVKVKKMVLGKEGVALILPSATSSTVQNYGDKSVLEEVVLHEGLTTIPAYSFSEYTKLSKITIPKSITAIGNYAFNLVPIGGDIDLPNLTGSIGNNAFSRTNIERIINLGKITRLLNSSNATTAAFGQCDNLKLVILPETLETIGGYIFYKCTSLETVVCHAITPPTLYSTSLSSTNSTFVIYVPDASVTAYREASGWSAYADRIYPISVYNEGGLAEQITFEDPAVEAICLANFDYNSNGYISKAEAASVTSLGTVFKDNTEIVSFDELQYFTGLTNIASNAFYGCTALDNISLPKNVTTINDMAFRGSGLTDYNLVLNNITKVTSGAFYGTKIRSVIMPDIVSVVGAYNNGYQTFGNCANLEYVLFGKNVTSISPYIFSNSHQMTMIVLATTPPTFGGDSFGYSGAVQSIYVPDESEATYEGATNWSKYASMIKPLSQLATDNPSVYEEVAEYL